MPSLSKINVVEVEVFFAEDSIEELVHVKEVSCIAIGVMLDSPRLVTLFLINHLERNSSFAEFIVQRRHEVGYCNLIIWST